MISSGRFSLGEECAPYKITRYVYETGQLTPQDTFVQARKVPLKQNRERLLNKYMRLTPSTQVSRCLCMWHDHATILKMGFIMVTVHVMYDTQVFLPSSTLATYICKLLPADIQDSILEFDQLRLQLKEITKNRTDINKKSMTARYKQLTDILGRKNRLT